MHKIAISVNVGKLNNPKVVKSLCVLVSVLHSILSPASIVLLRAIQVDCLWGFF